MPQGSGLVALPRRRVAGKPAVQHVKSAQRRLLGGGALAKFEEALREAGEERTYVDNKRALA